MTQKLDSLLFLVFVGDALTKKKSGETMTVIQPGLFLVMQRFPDRKDVLRHRFLSSQSFKSVCKDYQRCSEALDYWAKSEHEKAPDLYREYLVLLHEMESDIINSLEKVY